MSKVFVVHARFDPAHVQLGIVNYHLLEAVCARLVRKLPDLNGTTKPLKVWAGAMSQSVRIAMAHVRNFPSSPEGMSRGPGACQKRRNRH